MFRPLAVLRRSVLIVALSLPFLSALASPALAANHKHHLGLAGGYQKLLSDDLKDESIGIDFTNAGFGSISYRLSVLRNLDLTLDACATVSSDEDSGIDYTLTNSFFGPGVRIVSPNEGTRPFVQANFFFVTEKAEAESGGIKISGSENGAGFGISGGVDIRASELLSIPVTANYMYGKPSDDVSGLGINVGLTFNFGQLNK